MSGPAVDSLVEDLLAAGQPVRRDVPLGPLTTYRVGGPAAAFLLIEDAAGLGSTARIVARHRVPVLVVGRGSNLLVADAGFPGLALQLGDGFAEVDIAEVDIAEPAGGPVEVRAGGAASLPVVARRTAAAGVEGFEWAVGVPGSIGGAVRMNAGGHGADMAASLQSVRVVSLHSGEDVDMSAADLHLGYRTSALAASDVVVEARLLLRTGDRDAAQERVSEIVAWRRHHQPGGPNAGSVFSNPPGDSAGRLVDAAGGRGLRVGSAEVSTKHANFIQADPGGSADDVAALMVEMARLVADHAGVHLHPETVLVGDFSKGRPR